MNLRDLNYVVAVADERSFSKAALVCRTTQPTISNQLRKLEETLGVSLFERSNRQVVPTEAGALIVALARRMMADAQEIRETAKAAQDPLSGRLRIGAIPTVAAYLLPTLVPALRSAYPRLELTLAEEKTSALTTSLVDGMLDVAILALPLAGEGLETRTLFTDEFLLAVPNGHPLARRRSVGRNGLAGQKILLLDEGHCLRDQALDFCSSAGGREDREFHASSLETLRLMVALGSGITLVPRMAATPDDRIVYIPFAGTAPQRRIGLAWRKCSSRMVLVEALGNMLARDS